MNVPSRAASDGSGAMAVFYSILNRIGMIALQMGTGILTARVLHQGLELMGIRVPEKM